MRGDCQKTLRRVRAAARAEHLLEAAARDGRRTRLAVGETVILLTLPIYRGPLKHLIKAQGGAIKWQNSRRRLHSPVVRRTAPSSSWAALQIRTEWISEVLLEMVTPPGMRAHLRCPSATS